MRIKRKGKIQETLRQPYLVMRTSLVTFKDAISIGWVVVVLVVREGVGNKTTGFKNMGLIRIWEPQV